MRNFYEELGVDKSTSLEDIQKKIFQERKKWITRQNTSDPEKQKIAVDKLNMLNEASEVFDSDESRREYDTKLAAETGRSSTGGSSGRSSGGSGSGGSSSGGSSGRSSGGSSSSGSSNRSSRDSSGSSNRSSTGGSTGSSGSSNRSSTGSSSGSSGTGSSYQPRKKKGKGRLLFLLFVILVICFFKRDTIGRYLNAGVERGAIEVNGHSYVLYDDAEDWADARVKCEKKGGHLATVTGKEENKALVAYIAENGYNEVVFGLYNIGKAEDPTWAWVTGEKFKYSAWNEGEPNSSSENYGEYLNGGWNDCINDVGTSVYLCEWDYVPGDEGHEKGISNLVDLAINAKNSVMRIVRRTDYTLERVKYTKSLVTDLDEIGVSEVEADSYLTDGEATEYPAENMIDGSVKTCWREGEDGLGEGTKLKFSFEEKKELSYILIRPGNAKSKDAFKKCARPSQITVTINGVSETCKLADSNKWQAIVINGDVKTGSVKISIDSVNEGTDKEETCVSEVKFY